MSATQTADLPIKMLSDALPEPMSTCGARPERPILVLMIPAAAEAVDKFKRCCQNLPPEDRPTWELYSIRERNLMFCRAVQDILGLNAGKSWQDVQREISDDQVKRIHEAFASLWPEDTDLPSLLPRPRSGILRAVYLGMSDPRLISPMVLGWLPYFDEIVLAHPFVNPLHIRPEYQPNVIAIPAQGADNKERAPVTDAGALHPCWLCPPHSRSRRF